MQKKITVSKTAEQTIKLGVAIGKQLKGGECIELIADVGGGKTTLVRGIAKGAGSKSHVSSPSFTISKVYKTPDFDIVHFDFYRLQDAGLVAYEIQEAVYDQKTVVIVEWSDVVSHVLPEERLTIDLKAQLNGERVIKLEVPEKIGYLIENVEVDI